MMKKKIARVQRWLDRFSTACDNCRWDSAVVEADCLAAEVRDIREDIWNLLESSETNKQRIFTRDAVLMGMRSVVIALLIVMIATFPLSIEAQRPYSGSQAIAKQEKNDYEHLSWITPEEEELIRALRVELSGQNISVSKTADNLVITTRNRTAAIPKDIARPEAVRLKPAVAAKSEVGFTAEDLLALVQVGEKALHGGDPVIKVIK